MNRFYSVGLFAASSGKSASVLEAPPTPEPHPARKPIRLLPPQKRFTSPAGQIYSNLLSSAPDVSIYNAEEPLNSRRPASCNLLQVDFKSVKGSENSLSTSREIHFLYQFCPSALPPLDTLLTGKVSGALTARSTSEMLDREGLWTVLRKLHEGRSMAAGILKASFSPCLIVP